MSIKNWTAIIPLRAGSKGLPNKNIRKLAGMPLYQYSIECAKAAGAEKIIISTDIEEILEKKFSSEIQVIHREKSLSDDKAVMEDVIINLLSKSSDRGTFVLLQATSPLRTKKHIHQALSLFNEGHFSMVMSVTKADNSVLKWGMLKNGNEFNSINDINDCFRNRQNLPDVFKPNGAIYVFDGNAFMSNGGWPKDRIGVTLMSNESSMDIDNIDDFLNVERLLVKRK